MLQFPVFCFDFCLILAYINLHVFFFHIVESYNKQNAVRM